MFGSFASGKEGLMFESPGTRGFSVLACCLGGLSLGTSASSYDRHLGGEQAVFCLQV